MAGTWFKGIFITKRHHLSFVLLKLCELAHIQLETVTWTKWRKKINKKSHATLFIFLNLGIFFCTGNVKKNRHRSCTHIFHASFHPIYTVVHSTNPLKAWAHSYDITVKDFNHSYVFSYIVVGSAKSTPHLYILYLV